MLAKVEVPHHARLVTIVRLSDASQGLYSLELCFRHEYCFARLHRVQGLPIVVLDDLVEA